MTIRSIDWANPKEQDQHQDMGIYWMTEANIKRPLQKCDYLNKETEFWIGSDTKEQYEELIKAGIPDYWRFHRSSFSYKINSFGFRAPDFNTVDWRNSYVILGCSHVFGVGTPYHETIGQYIAKELNSPVINMGVGGATTTVIYNNFLKLIKDYGKPKGVFILWTYPTRQTLVNYSVPENNHSYIEPFWKRQDVIPGFELYKKVTIDDQYLNKCFYDRSIYLESTKQILHDTPLSMLPHPHCWVLASHVNPKKRPEDYPGVVVPVPSKHTIFRKIKLNDPSVWHTIPEESKVWYMNELIARDIHGYSKSGPGHSHWGRLIHKCIAKTMVENLK